MIFSLIETEVKFVAVRSRGPGGQNVNKVSSAAILLWDFNSSRGLNETQRHLARQKLQSSINKDGLIFLRSDEFRDLERNKGRCLEKLQALLTAAFHVPKYRRATKPSRSSKIRKQESKSRRSDIKKNRQRVR
jgi:ribosome-associated protein